MTDDVLVVTFHRLRGSRYLDQLPAVIPLKRIVRATARYDFSTRMHFRRLERFCTNQAVTRENVEKEVILHYA